MDSSTEIDWKRGRESNIPDCCIQFYTTLWKDPEIYRTHTQAMHSVGILSYIACPACLKKQRLNCLKLDEGGYYMPMVLGWRYRLKPTGTIWTMTGMDYRNNTIYWLGMTPEEYPFRTQYQFAWGFVQDQFELADKPITFTIEVPS